MAIQIKNCASIEAPFTHWFFYGGMRSGKTTAAATFPRPILIVPAQEGSEVALQGRADVDYVQVGGARDMDEAIAYLEQAYQRARVLWEKGEVDAGYKEFPWETIIVESVTHYCDLLQEEYTRGGKVDMDRQLWGKLSAHLRGVQARLRNLPVHVVFVALSRHLTDDKGKIQKTEPAFPGQMNFKLPSACEAVVYFERKAGNPNPIFEAHFNPVGKADAGTRFRELDTGLRKLSPFTFAQVREHLGW